MANLLGAPDDLPVGAKIRLTSNNQKTIESTVVAPSGGGGAGVDSFEGRSGVVVSASGDYNSTEVDNLSVNPGASVTDALNFLRALITGLTTGVSSFNGRVGAIVSANGDYSTSLVTNTSGVTGLTASDALNNLQAAISALVTGVSSFNARVGAVVPAAGDYTTSQVNNASGVSGATASDALNNLGAILLFGAANGTGTTAVRWLNAGASTGNILAAATLDLRNSISNGAPFARTIKDLRVELSGVYTVDVTYTVFVNGVATAITATVLAGATAANDNAHTASLPANGSVQIRVVGAGTDATTRANAATVRVT